MQAAVGVTNFGLGDVVLCPRRVLPSVLRRRNVVHLGVDIKLQDKHAFRRLHPSSLRATKESPQRKQISTVVQWSAEAIC